MYFPVCHIIDLSGCKIDDIFLFQNFLNFTRTEWIPAKQGESSLLSYILIVTLVDFVSLK